MNQNNRCYALIFLFIASISPYKAISQSIEDSTLSPYGDKVNIHPLTGNPLLPVNREELDVFGQKLYDIYVEEGLSFEEPLPSNENGTCFNSNIARSYEGTYYDVLYYVRQRQVNFWYAGHQQTRG